MINFKSTIINIGDIIILVYMVGDILLPSNSHFLNKNVTTGQRAILCQRSEKKGQRRKVDFL